MTWNAESSSPSSVGKPFDPCLPIKGSLGAWFPRISPVVLRSKASCDALSRFFQLFWVLFLVCRGLKKCIGYFAASQVRAEASQGPIQFHLRLDQSSMWLASGSHQLSCSVYSEECVQSEGTGRNSSWFLCSKNRDAPPAHSSAVFPAGMMDLFEFWAAVRVESLIWSPC